MPLSPLDHEAERRCHHNNFFHPDHNNLTGFTPNLRFPWSYINSITIISVLSMLQYIHTLTPSHIDTQYMRAHHILPQDALLVSLLCNMLQKTDTYPHPLHFKHYKTIPLPSVPHQALQRYTLTSLCLLSLIIISLEMNSTTNKKSKTTNLIADAGDVIMQQQQQQQQQATDSQSSVSISQSTGINFAKSSPEEQFEEDRAGMMGDKADGANSLDESSPRK